MAEPVDFKDLGIGKLKTDLASLQSTSVTIGWQGESGAKKHPDADATIATVAAWQEYGTDTAPARPSLVQTFERHRADFIVAAKAALASVIDQGVSAEDAETRLGEFAVEKLRQTIDDSRSWAEPNAKSTIRSKGHDQPLFGETGAMRANSSYAIRRGGQILRQGGETGD